MNIMRELPHHAAAIRSVNAAAFGGEDEAALVDQLRSDGLVRLSLVATDGDDVVGHILFSRLGVEVDDRPVNAVSLAPLAVHPDSQRRGVGTALVKEGLSRLQADACEAVVVLGHPAYYRRFGFSAAKAAILKAPFRGDAFITLALTPGALDGASGRVVYPPAFGIG